MYSEAKDVEKKPQLPPARDEPQLPPVYEVIPYEAKDVGKKFQPPTVYAEISDVFSRIPNDYEVSSDAKKNGTLVDENHLKNDNNMTEPITLQNGSATQDHEVNILYISIVEYYSCIYL